MGTMRRENPMVTRSRAALIGAATRLLEGREAADISVTDVVTEAGMSRPTFYQHFADLGALFAAAGLARLEEVFARSEASRPAPADSAGVLAERLGVLAARLGEQAVFYARIHASQGGSAFHAGAVSATAARLRREPLLRDRVGEEAAHWEFLAAGVVWLITRHLATLCRTPPADHAPLAADLTHILEATFRKVLSPDWPTRATGKLRVERDPT